MVKLYADLVEWGMRVLDPEDLEEGEILVPAFLREQVRTILVDERGLVQYKKK